MENCMEHCFLPRTLWYCENRERIDLAHTELHIKFNIRAQPLIILGEAGMGKTTLLGLLAKQQGYQFVTAHQLLHPPRDMPNIGADQVLVIDALDELTANSPAEAIERVLSRLGEKNYPPFLLSCRAADWFVAAGIRSVESAYGRKPVQLHLSALNDEEILRVLNDQLSHEVVSDLVEGLRARGLNDWLGNPYTLELLVESAKAGQRPQSRTQVFEFATRQLLKERNEVKSADGPSPDLRRRAAGAACAALIIGGHEALCRSAESTTDLPLAEVRELPDACHLSHALATRLFEAVGPDRFKYAHRSLGEYLAAQWIMRCADTPRKRRRLLALLHRQGMVPSHLRGLHAWLALDSHLAPEVIATDPMGIIEYGDIGQLSEGQASMLLRALRRLATNNPGLLPAHHQINLREMIKPGIKTELLAILPDKGTSFQLRLLLLESIQGSPVVNQLETILWSLVVNPREAFALRRAALKALCVQQTSEQATKLLVLLRSHGSNDASQLALDLIGLHGYSFPDTTMAECVICCEHHPSRIGDIGFSKYDHVTKHFPTERMASFLNVLTASISSPEPFSPDQQKSELADLVMQLIGRYLKEQIPDISELWSWLHFSALHGAFALMAEETHQHLLDDSALRRRLQKWVLLENVVDARLMQRYHDLHRASHHLGCSEEDAIVLLDSLDPQDLDDQRWQEIVGLIHHTEDQGTALREAAHAFAAEHDDRLAWLAQLQLYPSNRENISLAEELERQHALEQQQKLSALRSTYLGKIESILKGSFTSLIEFAQIYLDCSKAFRFEACDTERLTNWLGQDLVQSLLTGFETYLQQVLCSLSITEIAHFFGLQQWFLAAKDLGEQEGLSPFIIAAALTARHQDGRCFKDLDEHVLMAGFLAVNYLFKDDLLTLQKALNSELKSRNRWQETLRLRCEPNLHGSSAYDGLSELLYDEEARIFAAGLARTWLEQFASLPADTERELARMLLNADEHEALSSVARSRTLPTKEHGRIWDSVGLVVSFDETRERLEQNRPDKHLLLELRELVVGHYGALGGHTIKLQAQAIAWVINRFRSLWPLRRRQQGDLDIDFFDNNASDCLVHLIDVLGNLTTPEALQAMQALCDVRRNSYTERMLDARANQRRRAFDRSSEPATISELKALAKDAAPNDVSALKAFVLDELHNVQEKIYSDDVDSWRGFYCGDQRTPRCEDDCRNWLISLLRQGSTLVGYEPEPHLAADKEADIACFAAAPRISIEVKGQWHRSVWTAADDQLDRLYTRDNRARGNGIYLVLWFGRQAKRKHALTSPGGKTERPCSPSVMKDMLEQRCKAFQQGRIEIVVLDLTRQAAT
ncbi:MULTISPECIES: ATP-binding protein [Pseudomonas syringae group]|nr:MULTISPECIES: ATP-binding protein [Pseudomonas syringae group]